MPASEAITPLRGSPLATAPLSSTTIHIHFEGSNIRTANPLIGITGFYREVLPQLAEPVPMFRQQMVIDIRRCFDLLTNERKKTPVVIVDEAQLMEHRMLEELRLLLNVRVDSQAGAALRLHHAQMAGFAEQKQVLDEMVLRQVVNDPETAT